MRSFHNTILTLETVAYVANVILHLVDIKQEVFAKCVNPQFLFIDLCNCCDEDGTPTTSLYQSKSSLQMNYFSSTSIDSPYFNIEIPSTRDDHLC
jgi:hypothetical protein